VAAIEAFHKDADISRSLRPSSTLPHRATAGQNRWRYRDPAAVEDKDSVLPPLGVKKQVPSVRDADIQVDQPQHTPIKVPLRQPSGTSSVKTTAMQADLPQRSPRTDNPQ